ncbi:hypothetical protein L226DRAFT_202354 [Lentinus tigrinus ALCF2SS1-7]|uniref:Uncharacterized protein n=1 Tax=Lentinus tigrinus ALCF2SS1-6 TaxID=1328759 RepID=A0A5C2SRR5_9APHY|nr:hypothetical protein L227DRAFT_148605 [Lentinus tigrinus ALCF2SS1-6]RPD80498.1 hypothetical protein L226DRAFT_202354 [Lentinus tigrinus ALCF2SS1-7]
MPPQRGSLYTPRETSGRGWSEADHRARAQVIGRVGWTGSYVCPPALRSGCFRRARMASSVSEHSRCSARPPCRTLSLSYSHTMGIDIRKVRTGQHSMSRCCAHVECDSPRLPPSQHLGRVIKVRSRPTHCVVILAVATAVTIPCSPGASSLLRDPLLTPGGPAGHILRAGHQSRTDAPRKLEQLCVMSVTATQKEIHDRLYAWACRLQLAAVAVRHNEDDYAASERAEQASIQSARGLEASCSSSSMHPRQKHNSCLTPPANPLANPTQKGTATFP